jgi:hypothetical protein
VRAYPPEGNKTVVFTAEPHHAPSVYDDLETIERKAVEEGHRMRQDVEYAVHAANLYPELVAALEWAMSNVPIPYYRMEGNAPYYDKYNTVRELLAKCEEE